MKNETYYSIVCILNGFEDKLSPLLEKQAQKNRMAKLCKIDIAQIKHALSNHNR